MGSFKADKRQTLAQSWEVLDDAISFLPPRETPQVVFIARRLLGNDWLLPRSGRGILGSRSSKQWG